MQQLTQFVMGNGAVSLSDTIVNPMIAAIRKEFEAREQKLTEAYEQKLAALANENKRLKSRKNKNDDPNGEKGRQDENADQSSDELDLNGEDVPDEQIVKVALRLKEIRSRKGEKCPRR